MSKKAFIGLILLIAALMVASVPALLTPASQGVERAAEQVGLLQPVKPEPPAEFPKASKQDKPAKKRLELRGWELEKDGDMRDTIDPLDRESFGTNRLADGSRRALLPGQRDRSGEAPPATSEDGVLLDITGCPVFREGTDVLALLADPDVQNRYEGKVADADDPAACEVLYATRVLLAGGPQTTSPLGAATARERGAIRRGGTSSMVVAFKEIELLSQFMDDRDLQRALEAIAPDDEPTPEEAAAALTALDAIAG